MRESATFRLRDGQKKAVDRVCLESKADGVWRVLLVSPPGSGKTVMAMEYVRRAREAGISRILFAVHREELRAQVLAYDSGLTVETIQTLVSRGTFPPADLVIIDEAHHYVADSWASIFEAYPRARMMGLTATPERADGRPMGGNIWHAMVVAAHYPELVADGRLADCKTVRPDQFIGSDLARDPVEAYLEHAPGRQGFVYVRYVQEAKALAAKFTARGVTAEVIAGETGTEERKKRLDRFKSGTTRLLVNVFVLTEGVDVPAASVCIMARGCGHRSTYLQMVGRVLRPHPGKDYAVLLDLPGVSHLHGLPIMRREYSLGAGIRNPGEKSVAVKDCPQCGAAMHPAVMICDCGWRFEVQQRQKPKIWSLELVEAWAGDQTPDDAKKREYRRLRRFAQSRGWSIGWVVKEYTKLFGQAPGITDVSPEERKAEHQRLLTLAHKRGYQKPTGWAAWAFKRTFGVWPPHANTKTRRTG